MCGFCYEQKLVSIHDIINSKFQVQYPQILSYLVKLFGQILVHKWQKIFFSVIETSFQSLNNEPFVLTIIFLLCYRKSNMFRH